jgi:hypothetical protein
MTDNVINIPINNPLKTKIRELENIIYDMDGALCQYLNSCRDGFEPVSEWDEESWENFKGLSEAYNSWHKDNPEIHVISMRKYKEPK